MSSNVNNSAAIRKATTPLPKWQIVSVIMVQLSESTSINILFPFVAFMVEDMGFSKNHLGIYSGLLAASFCGAQFFSAVLWGKFSDVYGRKPAVIFGTMGSGIGLLVFGFAKHYPQAMIGRIISGTLAGNLGVLKSFLTEITDDTNRAVGFSYISSAWSVGTILAPLAGGLLCKPAIKYPHYFAANGVFGIYPYLLPCCICVFFSVMSSIVCFFVMTETRNFDHNKIAATATTDSAVSSNSKHNSSSSSSKNRLEVDGSSNTDNNTDISIHNPMRHNNIEGSQSRSSDTNGSSGIELIGKQNKYTISNDSDDDDDDDDDIETNNQKAINIDNEAAVNLRDRYVDKNNHGSVVSNANNANNGYNNNNSNDSVKDDNDETELVYEYINEEEVSIHTILHSLKCSVISMSTYICPNIIIYKFFRSHNSNNNNNNNKSSETLDTTSYEQLPSAAAGGVDKVKNYEYDDVNSKQSRRHRSSDGNNNNNNHIDDVDGSEYSSIIDIKTMPTNKLLQNSGNNKGKSKFTYAKLGKDDDTEDYDENNDDYDDDNTKVITDDDNNNNNNIVQQYQQNPNTSSSSFPQQKQPVSVLRLKTVLLVTSTYGIFAMGMILLDETIPLFLKLDDTEGGMSFDSSQIGFLLSICGIALLFFSSCCLPYFCNRYLKATLFRVSICIVLPSIFGWPIISQINQYFVLQSQNQQQQIAANDIYNNTTHAVMYTTDTNSNSNDDTNTNNTAMIAMLSPVLRKATMWVFLVTFGVIKALTACSAFTAVSLQINHSVYDKHLGAVNGLGQSMASLARAIGPATGGLLWSVSVTLNLIYLNFITVGIILLLSIYMNSLLPSWLEKKRQPVVINKRSGEVVVLES